MGPRLNHRDYTVAWIAVLPIEAEAALGVLDKRHEGQFESVQGDDYIYIGGEINGHNVVVATNPAGQNYGVGSAAALASQIKARFPNIRFALLVGVAAGLPNLSAGDPGKHRDIRLGDVLVSVPDKDGSGIIHYDLGRDTEEGFLHNGRSAESPAIVRSAIGNIQLTQKRPFRTGNQMARHLANLQSSMSESTFECPSQEGDQLYVSFNAGSTTSANPQIFRQPREELERSRVWYGNIGSGNSVVKHAKRRDELRDMHDLIGLEMEAAGVANILPVGVIRGVCDYGDANKGKTWQPYAAAVAAVYAKGILCAITMQTSQTIVAQKTPVVKGKPVYYGPSSVWCILARSDWITLIVIAFLILLSSLVWVCAYFLYSLLTWDRHPTCTLAGTLRSYRRTCRSPSCAGVIGSHAFGAKWAEKSRSHRSGRHWQESTGSGVRLSHTSASAVMLYHLDSRHKPRKLRARLSPGWTGFERSSDHGC